MIELVHLKVRSLDVDFHRLTWEVDDTSEDVSDYDIQVLKSESSSGPFLPISVPFSDRYVFVDRFSHPFHLPRTFHYLLRVTNRLNPTETKDFGPVNMQPDADLVTMELRRHMNLLYREFTGRRCWLLPVRTFGTRCSCWDAVRQKRTRSHCIECFDTGYLRGYNYPIEVWTQIDPGSNLSEQNTNVGPMHQYNTTGRMSDIGIVKPRDVLVEAENLRWRVTAINQTEHSRAPIYLELTLHKIPSSDMEYRIPLNLGMPLEDLALSPARNFTNPHNLQNFEQEEIPKIFQLYGSTYTDVNK